MFFRVRDILHFKLRKEIPIDTKINTDLDSRDACILSKSIVDRILSRSLVTKNHSHWYMSLPSECHLYVRHPYVIVCTSMSSVCHSHVLVCHPYVTRLYSYVIRTSLVCGFTMNRNKVILKEIRLHFTDLTIQHLTM